jgi:cell division protein FtsB
MKKITQISIAVFSMFLMASCSDSKKDDAAIINDKKAALEKLKIERVKNDEEIKKLQAELEKLDSNSGQCRKS